MSALQIGALAIGGAVGAYVIALAMGALMQAVGTAFRAALGLVFVTKEMNDPVTREILLAYLTRHGRIWSLGQETYDASRCYIQSERGPRTVMSRCLNTSTVLIWYRGRPMLLRRSFQGTPTAPAREASFIFLRGAVGWDRLVTDAAAMRDEWWAADRGDKRFKVYVHQARRQDRGGPPDAPPTNGQSDRQYRTHQNPSWEPINYAAEDIGEPPDPDPVGYLSLTEPMRLVLQRVVRWSKSRNWCAERSIAHRLGVFLHGRPGTGKTSLIRAIAMFLDMPVHVIRMEGMDAHDFSTAWSMSRASSPRIVVLEEIDTTFHKRENVSKGGTLSWATVLNTLDGIEREDGLLLFVTSNHPELLDEALGVPDENGRSTRPGRINMTVELGGLDLEGRLKMARRILQDEAEAHLMATSVDDRETADRFQEMCVKRSLEIFWGDETDQAAPEKQGSSNLTPGDKARNKTKTWTTENAIRSRANKS